ncbi:MAG: acyl carrier protein [Candidatus Acidiferrum sp.]
MDEQQKRLANCFCAVFPELSGEEIIHASPATVQSWDSVAVVTLLTVIEEEFGISIEEDDPAKFDSFQRILSYLQEAEKKSQSPSDVG